MTRLTAEAKSGEWNKQELIRMKIMQRYYRGRFRHDFSYTNFSGNYGNPMTRKEMSETLKRAESARRQKFW